MINPLLKNLVDLLYGTYRVKKRYELEHPDETVLAADACKGIVNSSDRELERGLDWVGAQRAVILLSDEKIVCGRWTIMLDDIETAQLIKINSLFGGAQVLKIQTKDDRYYQFGMQTNPDWTRQTALVLLVEKGQLKYSTFSIVVRLLLIGYLLYWVYDRFFAY